MTTAEIARAKGDIEAAALRDAKFDWAEAERLAALPDFRVADELAKLKGEMSHA